MNDPLIISNAGPLIVSSNYWQTEAEAHGKFYLSINARAFRLLIPRMMESHLVEMGAAKLVIVQRPRNPSPGLPYAIRLLFDDGGKEPLFLDLSVAQVDRMPLREDAGRNDLEFTAWTQPRRDEGPHEALRRPAAFSSVARLE